HSLSGIGDVVDAAKVPDEHPTAAMTESRNHAAAPHYSSPTAEPTTAWRRQCPTRSPPASSASHPSSPTDGPTVDARGRRQRTTARSLARVRGGGSFRHRDDDWRHHKTNREAHHD